MKKKDKKRAVKMFRGGMRLHELAWIYSTKLENKKTLQAVGTEIETAIREALNQSIAS
jgi:transcription termination factor NusB